MKLRILYIFALVIVSASCNSTYYQVYRAEVGENILSTSNGLIYEDDNCRISYDLWKDGGSAGFVVENKTDQDLHLHLDESYFILNGIAYDYFQSRIFTNTTGTATSNIFKTNSNILFANPSMEISSALEISHREKEVVTIPAGTAKIFNEFQINNMLFRDCDLYKYPNKRQINTIHYSETNSPFVFGNLIAISIGEEKALRKINNQFFVSAITNYPETELIRKDKVEFCGDKGNHLMKHFKESSPDAFYIKYTKKQGDYLNH